MNPAAAAVIGVYRRHGADWARARGTALPERPWLDRFSALIPRGGAVLDLGCGSGEPVARYLARQGHRITGVDAAPEQAALFAATLPDQQVIVADMRDLAIGCRFGGILAWDSVFHLPRDDQRAMFAVFRDHALPNAPVMLTSGPDDGEAIGQLGGEPLYHASLAAADYRALFDAAGFAIVAHVVEEPLCCRTIWLARRRPG